MSEWISVKDRLPENDRLVLVSTKYFLIPKRKTKILIGYNSFRSGWCVEELFIDGDDINDHVTHWLELPQPPKETDS